MSASQLLASEVQLCAGDPGTRQGAGRSAGLSGSHALGKFPGCSPPAGSSRAPTGAHAPHRSRGEGLRRAWGRSPKTSGGRASPRPAQGRSLPRAPPEREDTRCPLSAPATQGDSPAVSQGAAVERAMASAARSGTSQPAEPRRQQQLQQRGRLSGARGLHCSPRRRHRAALRAQPRVPWSHAPPALASATRTRARPARGPLRCPTSSVGASRTLCTPDDPKPGVSPGHCVGLSSALSTIVGMARPRAEHKGRGAPCKGQKAKTVSHHLLGMKSRSRVLAGTGQYLG